MSKLEKFVAALLSGNADRNIEFAALCGLLVKLGFTQRIKGSHHIFACAGVVEIINLQPGEAGKAKPYQIRQVRELLLKYHLTLTPAPALRIVRDTPSLPENPA